MLKWTLLLVAIAAEVVATLLIKVSDGWTRPWPVVGVLSGYALAFYLDAKVVQLGIPIAVTYAIWSGAGIVLVAAAAWILFKDALEPVTIVGMSFLIVGVIVTALGTIGVH